MDQKQLDAIKERVENASMGPWKIYENEDGTCIGTAYDHPQLKSPLPVVGIAIQGKEPNRIINIFKENAEFIAHARQDVPALLAEVERLREALKEVFEISKYDGISKRLDNCYIVARQALGGEYK